MLTTERNDYQTISKTTNERMKEIEHAKQVNLEIKSLRNDGFFSSLQTVEERFKELENDKTRLDKDKSIAEKQLKDIEGARRGLFDKNRVKISIVNQNRVKSFLFSKEHQEDLVDLIHEKEILEQKILDLEQTTREWAQKFLDATDKQKLLQTNHEHLLHNIKRQYKCKTKFFYEEKKILPFYKIRF